MHLARPRQEEPTSARTPADTTGLANNKRLHRALCPHSPNSLTVYHRSTIMSTGGHVHRAAFCGGDDHDVLEQAGLLHGDLVLSHQLQHSQEGNDYL